MLPCLEVFAAIPAAPVRLPHSTIVRLRSRNSPQNPSPGTGHMISSVSADHPRQKLVFFIAQDVDDELRLKVREFVEQLAGTRHWLNGPPQFVDEMDETPSSDPNDLPI